MGQPTQQPVYLLDSFVAFVVKLLCKMYAGFKSLNNASRMLVKDILNKTDYFNWDSESESVLKRTTEEQQADRTGVVVCTKEPNSKAGDE